MEAELVSVSGEMETEDDEVTREEVIASLTSNDVPDALKAAIRGEIQTEHDALSGMVGEMRVVLELDEASDPQAVLDKVKELVDSDARQELEEKVNAKVAEEVAGELMQTAITERLASTLPLDASEEDIAGEIAKAKELPHIKALAGSKIPTVVGGGDSGDGGSNQNDKRQATSWA